MNRNGWLTIGCLVIIVIIIIVVLKVPFGAKVDGKKANLDTFAQCLAQKNIKMYGAYWCSHCQNQKKEFGDSFQYVSYIECTEKAQECTAAGVEGFPTWIFPDGHKLVGEQTFEKLSADSGCPL